MDNELVAREAAANAKSGDISEKYEIPELEPFISFNALKDRIQHYYEVCSDYYYSI